MGKRKYFARRNVTDIPETRRLDNIFMSLIDECNNNNGHVSHRFIIDYLTDSGRFASLELFRKRLEGYIYEENAAAARFVLCEIEEAQGTRETFVDFWKRDDNSKYLWTVEHIFPEGRNIPVEWVNMIANGNKEEAMEQQGKWVHKLGNLTLTGYNPTLSNLSFDKKRDRTDHKGSYIGYRNGLYLNRSLANRSSWHVNDIDDRTNQLVKEALELFAIKEKKSIS